MINRLLKTLSSRDRIVVGAMFCIGLIFTIGVLFEVAREIDRQEHAIFAEEKNHVRDSLADQLRAASETLHNLAVLFTVSATEIDSDGFRMIAEAALAQQRAVNFLSFARWVDADQKVAFEEKNWRASGVAHFKIHSENLENNLPKHFLPIVYLEPLSPKSIGYLGYDLWSESEAQKHIQQAIDSGQSVVNRNVSAPKFEGFTLLKAVYTGKDLPTSIEQRQKSVLGILRVSLSSADLMGSLSKYENFALRLSANPSGILAVKDRTSRKTSFEFSLLEKVFVDELPLNIANASYNLRVEKAVPFTPATAGIYLLVLVVGSIGSLLAANRISFFLRAQREILERQAEIEAKVEEKTKALKQSEDLLRQVINSNPNVIFAQSKDQRILFANRTFFEVFRKTEAEVYNQKFPMNLHLRLPGESLPQGSCEEEILLESGQKLWFETHRVDIELEGHGICKLIVAVDISQRKLANAVIADQRAKMVTSAKLSALGEMAGGIAHEINTPLTTLQLCSDFIAETLKMRNPDLKSIEEENQMVARTTERIGKIVSGLRNFSKDGSQDEMKSFCLTQTIENTLSLCREKFRHSAIFLDWQSPGRMTVVGREVQISQVILNLLNNSFDAVQGIRAAWIKIRLKEQNGSVEISVEDNGYGVSEEAKDKLFQPFFTTKESGKGTGLGLSISRGIVENHSGQLRLEHSGSTTRFVIQLPMIQGVTEKRPNDLGDPL